MIFIIYILILFLLLNDKLPNFKRIAARIIDPKTGASIISCT